MNSARSFRLLVNPTSGGGKASSALVPVARILRDAGHRVEVTWSPGVEAVADLAASAVAAGEIVVSVGGDGMVASLAGPVADLSASGGVLGLVPAGRGNDFARMLGISGSPEEVAQRLMRGEPRTVDLIDCGGVMVAGSVYAGIDSDAAQMVARMTRMPKALQYPWAGLRAMLRYRPRRFRLVLDGQVREFDAGMVVVANSQYYGKGMRVAPDASLDDGLLDVVVVGALNKAHLVTTMVRIYAGTHVQDPAVQVMQAREVLVSVAGEPPLALGGDGEDLGVLPGFGAEPLRVAVRERALRVL